jgi:hypothetical protein
MIRPFTCVCMVLAGVSGLYLYQAKHRVQLLDRDITNTIHATETARQRIGVLRAEWTLQNDPERLAQLADRFLTLKTVTPGQFTSMAELDRRLPPLRPPPEATPPAMDEDTPIASVPESEAEPAKVASIPEPRPEPSRPMPPRTEPPRREAAAPRPPPVKVATVASRPPERRHEPAPPPPRMAAAETRSVITRAMATIPRPVSPVATYTPVAAPAPAVTSVLGISRSAIAPPVPFLTQPLTTTGSGG